MHKKRKFALGRPAAMTRIGATRVHDVRARGGLIKHRAILLENGNFAWPSEAITKKTRIIEVLYNASNNELVRTNTLVKGAIVAIDAAPFVDWYKGYYGRTLAKTKEVAPVAAPVPTAGEQKKKAEKAAKKAASQKEKDAKREAKHKKAGTAVPVKKAKEVKKTMTDVTDAVRAQRLTGEVIDPAVQEQIKVGRVLARITSRPGQIGTCDGYILEGAELQFYLRKLAKKR
jgi:small subunit ribosomal protein S8e